MPSCVFGTPISGTGTPLDGINQINNMPLFEVEDAAMAALQNWVTKGVAPPHSPPISTIPVFFGAVLPRQHEPVRRRCRAGSDADAKVPAENYSAINFATRASEPQPAPA